MKTWLVCVLVVVLRAEVSNAGPATVAPPLFLEAQNAALSGAFAAAESLATLMTLRSSEDPSGFYARAALEQIRLFGCEDKADLGTVRRFAEQAVSVGSARVRASPEDVWARYILGLALGLAAVHAIDTGSYFDAYRSGNASLRELHEVLRRDPSFADAHLALGTYYFWRGSAMHRWDWLPFVDDTRAQGIAEMRSARRNGRTTQSTATGMLAWALIEQRDWNEALLLTAELVRQYPNSRSFLSAHARALSGVEKWNDAAEVHTRVLATYSPQERHCVGFATSRAWRAVALAESRRCDEAARDLRAIQNYQVSSQGKREFERLRSEAGEAVARCKETRR